MGYVISISNVKGGVAKTSTSIALGRSLSKMGYRVLLVDLDPQADLTLSVGVHPSIVSYASKDLFIPGIFKEFTLTRFLLKTSYENLDIIPSNGEIVWNEQRLADFEGSKDVIKNALNSGSETLYDFVVIDCPPAIGTSTISALMASDLVIIPTQAEYFSANSLAKMIAIIRNVRKEENPNLKYKVLVTMLDLRNRIQRTLLEEFHKGFKENLFRTAIVIDTKIRESHSLHIPIVDYKPNSRGAIQYLALAKELIEVLDEVQKPKITQSPIDAIEEELSEESLNIHCPFLGFKDDLSSVTNYSSEMNYCHRAKPNAVPKFDHQSKICLTSAYLACPLLNTRIEIPLPTQLRERPPSLWNKLGF